VGNPTNGQAQGTMLHLEIPPGANFLSASDGGTFADGVVEWSLGTFGIGQTASREVVLQLDETLVNGEVERAVAEVEDSTGRRTRATTQSRIETGVPLLLTVELNPDPVQPNETMWGRLTVTNTGVVPLLGVTAEVLLPATIAVFNPNITTGGTA